MSKLSPEQSMKKVIAAEKMLGNKRDVKLVNNKVFILNGKDTKVPLANDMGIKAWGHLDCLVNFGGYRKYFVSDFKNLHLAR